jgi:hypothetical protein
MNHERLQAYVPLTFSNKDIAQYLVHSLVMVIPMHDKDIQIRMSKC